MPTVLGKPDPQAAPRLRRQLPWALGGVASAALAGVLPWLSVPAVLIIGGVLVHTLWCWWRSWGAATLFGDGAAASLFGAGLGLLVAALVVVPVGVAHAGAALLSPSVLLVGVAVAAISSALPISLEMMALKRLPKEAFGIMISMEPAVAALLALVLLGERLDTVQWLAIGCIVAASITPSTTTTRP